MATKTKKKSKNKDLQKELKKTTDDAIKSVKTTAESVQQDLADVAGDVKDATQNVFLAGLGALAMAEEEGSKLFKKLVKKGKKVELPELGATRVKAIREQLDDASDKASDAVTSRVSDAKYMAEETADKVEDRIQDAVAVVMKRIGVPTREEISELTASVERLTTHIDTLKAERTATDELVLEAVGGGWYEIRLGDVVVEKVQGKETADKAFARVQEQRA
ncbi:MAG: hypothetical protein Rubg2KO_04380 [Rubricoccaceae bacterium]